jgi:hypothetical protein
VPRKASETHDEDRPAPSTQAARPVADAAPLHPPHRVTLLALRDEIKTLAGQIAGRTHVAARLSSAVLGHLNTVVRLLAGAVEKAGLYTKHGVPSVSSRIGVMEAVG